MAKALRTAAIVVGAVALVATGIGAAIGGAMAAGSAVAGSATFLGVAGTTWAAIGTFAALGSGVLSVGASLMQPGFSQQGNPTNFQTDPQSGLPYAMGRTRMSGIRFFAETTNSPGYTKAEDLLFFGALLCAGGQIDAIETFKAGAEVVAFNASTGAAVSGNYAGEWMSQKVWTGGQQSSGLSLTLNGGAVPGWTSAHRLSGLTHALWGLRYDTKGEKYAGGIPDPAWIGRWVKVYDPRLDSTYPGGSGPCRPLQEGTYVWSRNPGLHALTWALGRWQNGKRVLGIGAPLSTIRFSDFVTAANVCDANKWYCGGVEYSTDSKWDIFKRILQAGGSVPSKSGAMIGCRVNAPRISVATITAAHLLDGISITATKPRRERINSLIPRYRSEAHDFEVISARPITVPELVARDGGIRQREYDLPLVQNEIGQGFDGDLQAGQLCAYAIMNVAIEAGPIQFTTGPQFLGLKSGDCVTLDVPEEGLDAQPVIITSVSLDPATGKISFVAETETDSKHAFALGESAVPPPAYALTPPDIVPPTPTVDAWGLGAALDDNGMPYLTVYGDLVGTVIDSVIVQYKRTDSADWLNAGTIIVYQEDVVFHITGVDGRAEYEARIAYHNGALGPWRLLAPVTTPVSRLTEIEAEFNDLAEDTAAALATAQAAQEAADAAEAAIIAAGGEITTLNTLVAAQGVSITENATAISNTAGDLADLTVTVGTLDSTVTSQATAIDTLEITAASLETTVAAQGSAITTNADAISTLTSEVASFETIVSSGSPNLLTNGGFEAGLQGWGQVGTWFTTKSGWGNFAYTTTSGTSELFSQKFPVTAGRAYTIAGDWAFSASGGAVYLDMLFYDAGGSLILDGGQSPCAPTHDFRDDRSGRDLIKHTDTAPAGAVEAVARFVVEGGVGVTFAGIRQIKVEQGTTASQFSSEASVTQSFLSVNGAFARAALTLDVGGRITGWETNNNGTTGNFIVHADYFAIVKPGGGERTEYSDGNWRVYYPSGQIAVQLGVGF